MKYLDDIPSLKASLKNYSVVVETDSDASDEVIRDYADGLLKLKCKDFYFTGDDKARWHMLFDREDDRVSDGKALTSDIHDTDFLNFLHICKSKVLVLRQDPEIRLKKRKGN